MSSYVLRAPEILTRNLHERFRRRASAGRVQPALNDRLSSEFLELVGAGFVDDIKARRRTGPQLLEAVDGIIDSTMLSDDAARWFAQSYFSLIDGGRYLQDFCTAFGVSAQSEKGLYSVADSWENYARIAGAIDLAFAAQQKGR